MSPKEIKYGKNIEGNIYFVKQLDNLGISRKYTGFYLMVELMNVLINEDRKISSFSKQIYPQIAEKYGKTTCTIERNIRNLISRCWNISMMEKLGTYVPESKRPTCRTFVFLVKNYITKQIS